MTASRTLLLLLLAGCGETDFPHEWFLDRTRILAVRSVPAEPGPGDRVAFEALTWAPDAAVGLSWSVSTPPIGVFAEQPGEDPVLDIPEELLQVLDLDQLSEGLNVPVEIAAWPLSDPDGDVEHAIKYLPVSLAETPNNNPGVAMVEADTMETWGGQTIRAKKGETLHLDAAAANGSIEDYVFIDANGERERRQEDLSWRWYTDLGSFGTVGIQPGGEGVGDALGDIGGDDEVDWTAPGMAATGVVYLVVLDGRGGMGWSWFALDVR